MNQSEPFIAGALLDLSALHTAIIDSSSIIYMQKAGYLSIVTCSIRLITVSAVCRETGFKNGIELIENDLQNGMDADEQLIILSEKTGYPVISEDKRILLELKKKGKTYFNSLMILIFLRMRKKISDEEYKGFEKGLRKVARYSDKVWEFGEEVYGEVLGEG